MGHTIGGGQFAPIARASVVIKDDLLIKVR